MQRIFDNGLLGEVFHNNIQGSLSQMFDRVVSQEAPCAQVQESELMDNDDPLLSGSEESLNQAEHDEEMMDTTFEASLDADANFDSFNQCDNELSDQEIYQMILLLQIRHGMTDAAICDWAKFINAILRTKRLYISYNAIMKNSKTFSPDVKKYFYTSGSCGVTQAVSANHKMDQLVSCSTINCRRCEVLPCNVASDGFFCYISLSEWLTFLIPLLYDKMNFNHQPDGINFHDVTDGMEYNRLKQREQIIKSTNNDFNSKTITLSLGYDGANFTNDGSKSLWPIVGYVNELPVNIRWNNGMLLALHAGTKPNSKAIFKPLIDELLKYDTSPISVEIAPGRIVQFYVRLLLLIADAPARADVLNCKQYNGKFGCSWCKVLTESYSVKNPIAQKSTTARKYPMTTDQEVCPPRTNDEWRQMMVLADNLPEDEDIQGVKGQCQLSRLPYVHMNIVAPPEYMHSQLIGTVKLLIDIWLGNINGVRPMLTPSEVT